MRLAGLFASKIRENIFLLIENELIENLEVFAVVQLSVKNYST